MNKVISIIVCFFIFLSFQALSQQSREELEQEKRNALLKLQETEKILQQTEKKREVSLGQLNAINNQIKANEIIIQSIKGEINLINEDLSELDQVIESLEDDLENLKKEYAVMAYTSYKANFGLRSLVFIFSAPTFNQLLMRANYMNQYSETRKKQFNLIEEVKLSLVAQKSKLEALKQEQDELLNQEISQKRNLVILKKKQDSIVKSLSEKEDEIKQELDDRKKAIAHLDKLIADIVAAEIKATSEGRSTNRISMTESQSAVSKAFENSFGKLQWPVSSGFISSRFGSNPHPVYKRLTVPNDGIDIQTSENADVHVVFQGIVKAIAYVPGDMRYVVLVQHGDYFSVYAKLKDVSVVKGQILNANERIGVVNTDNYGRSEIQFQVWKNNEKLNPENWIAKK